MAASSAAAISVPQFVPEALAPEQERALKDAIRGRLAAENAALVAHYYTDRAVQELAEETGGCVADSLEMARFGQKHPAQTLVVAGVRFMGETAKILSPEKRVLMPTLEAECSLDLGCPPEAFSAFCDAHPDRTVVVYANTSAAVKARADWVVTSSIAVAVVEHLKAKGKRSSGHRISTLAATSRRPGRTWFSGTVPASSAKIQKPGPRGSPSGFSRRGGAGASGKPGRGSGPGRRGGFHFGDPKAAETLPNTSSSSPRIGIFTLQRKCQASSSLRRPRLAMGLRAGCAHCPWMAMNELEAMLASSRRG